MRPWNSLLAALIFTTIPWAVAADNPSPRESWLRAPYAQAKAWSREASLSRLASATKFIGMTRQQLIELLGEPGFADEEYELGAGRTGRIDSYRLSSKNDRSFRIDYDSGDRATGDMIEEGPCRCADCNSQAPSVPLKVLNMTILKKDTARVGQSLTIGRLESLLGQSGKISLSQQTAGGQVWMDYDDTWSIAGSEHRFLMVSGHRPARDWQIGDNAGLPVYSYSVISMAPGCLPPPSNPATH
jgi:hypothetical protein